MALGNFKKILGLWVVAGAVVFAVAWQLDASVDDALVTKQPEWHALASAFSKIGEGWVIAVAGLSATAAFFLLKRPDVAAKIFFVSLTSEIAGLMATILRVLIGRTRPNNHDVPQGIYGVWHDGHWLIGKYAFSSLPSGHAATAVGVAAAAWLIHRGWGALLWVYALGVMWSRIALECHHFSDVTASTFLAVIVALLMKKFYSPWNEKIFRRLARKFHVPNSRSPASPRPGMM